MLKFFHHLLNPHCEHCKDERDDARICKSCETLKFEIDRLRAENMRLLDTILEKPKEVVVNNDTRDLKPILPKTIPWNARRQMLESEDREKAKLMKQNENTTLDNLEKELGISGEN